MFKIHIVLVSYCAYYIFNIRKSLFYFETSVTIHEIINDGKSFEQLHDYAHPQMLTDTLNLHEIAKEFIHAKEERLKYFGNFHTQ